MDEREFTVQIDELRFRNFIFFHFAYFSMEWLMLSQNSNDVDIDGHFSAKCVLNTIIKSSIRQNDDVTMMT